METESTKGKRTLGGQCGEKTSYNMIEGRGMRAFSPLHKCGCYLCPLSFIQSGCDKSPQKIILSV